MPDGRLRMVFTRCHPALAVPAQVALTLRLLSGLTTTGVASAFHAVRADLLRRLGRSAEAAEAYGTALSLAGNGAERAFLERRLSSLG